MQLSIDNMTFADGEIDLVSVDGMEFKPTRNGSVDEQGIGYFEYGLAENGYHTDIPDYMITDRNITVISDFVCGLFHKMTEGEIREILR